MKSSLLNGLLCASLMVFVIGCGKESKSGPKSHSVAAFNPFLGAGMKGSQALTSLQQWLAAPESSAISIGAYKQEVANTSGFNFSGNFCFNNCLQNQYPKCFVRNSNNTYQIGSTSSTSCTNTVPAPVKSTNSTLINALNGEGGTLELFSINQTSGSKFELSYRMRNSFNSNPILVHVIDTALPSFLNPVYTYDSRIQKQTTLRILQIQ